MESTPGVAVPPRVQVPVMAECPPWCPDHARPSGACAQRLRTALLICCQPLFVFRQTKTSCSRGVILINFPMDNSILFSKEGCLAKCKTTWGQVLTLRRAGCRGGLWPGLDLGLPDPPVRPAPAHGAIW